MKIIIELIDGRWLVNGNKLINMSQSERELLNMFFKQIKNENKR